MKIYRISNELTNCHEYVNLEKLVMKLALDLEFEVSERIKNNRENNEELKSISRMISDTISDLYERNFTFEDLSDIRKYINRILKRLNRNA
tara:strand:- start:103 stop:375 length:273 start_codon:yes stop_codon:yes gene_type:complete